MKPNFALTLSFDGIGLLHRAFPGWHLVGEVALDSDDLNAGLTELRDKALVLDPSGLRCKLVIPNDQIRYLQFDAEDITGDDLPAAVRRALDGATPYPVDDLAYDWSFSAGRVYVAAVARETLSEAEAFATEHQFNPLSFVANPDANDFVGEPWFGETSHAAHSLPDGSTVERDTVAIRIIGTARLPDPDAPTGEKTLHRPAPERAPIARLADQLDTRMSGRADPLEEPDQPNVQPSDAESPSPEGSESPFEERDPADDETEAPAFRSIRATRGVVPSGAPRLEGAARGGGADIVPPLEPPAPPEDTPHTEVTGISEAALPEEQAAEFTAPLRPDPAIRLRAQVGNIAEPAEPLEQDPTDMAAARSFMTRRGTGAMQAAASLGHAAPAAATVPVDEKQRMTVFGARESAAGRGKPRFFGLILTAVLLLFLVGVAAWASIFLEEGLTRFFRAPQDSQVTDLPDEAKQSPQADISVPEADGEPEHDEEDLVIASLTPSEDDPDSALSDARPDVAPAELSPDEARARYAATGIWQMAPEAPQAPGLSSLDDFYQTSIDPSVTSQDAVALPGAEMLESDLRPPTPAVPPAAGTRFVRDSRGLVVATPEGAHTPDGVRVYAGRPALTPPPMPVRPDPGLSPEAREMAIKLASIRPRIRPVDLNEQNERSTLGGRTRSELAALRPRLRPKSAQQLAEEAIRSDPDAVNAAVAEAARESDPFAGATAQAVTASLKPRNRPGEFSKIVRRTEKARQTQAVSTVQKVTPRIPSNTTVARAATEDNAINLRKVNLIGVYGTPTNRRALVRLANGRYVKVKVGDRIDGGQVAAIGDSELRYVKRGRNVVLKMPKG